MPEETKQSTTRVLTIAFYVNVLDIVTNAIVAYITGSAVVFSEMMQGFADFGASVLLLVGHKRSKKPAGKLHPFGYGKEAFFWSLIATIMMFTITASFSIYRGIEQIVDPNPIKHIWLGLVVTGIGIISNFYAVWLNHIKIKKKNKSFIQSFREATDSSLKTSYISDFMGTNAAIVGFISIVLFILTGNVIFDALGAILIGLLLGILSFVQFIEIKGYLVGRAASLDTQYEIVKNAKSIKGVVAVEEIKTMYVGPHQLLVNLEVNLDDDLVTDEVEKVMDKIRSKVTKEIPEAKHIQIEAESREAKAEFHEDMNKTSKGGEYARSKKKKS